MTKVKREPDAVDDPLAVAKMALDAALGERQSDYWEVFQQFTAFKVSKIELDAFARAVLGAKFHLHEDFCNVLLDVSETVEPSELPPKKAVKADPDVREEKMDDVYLVGHERDYYAPSMSLHLQDSTSLMLRMRRLCMEEGLTTVDESAVQIMRSALENFVKDVLAACCHVRPGAVVSAPSAALPALSSPITPADLFAAIMHRPAVFGPLLLEAQARVGLLL